MLLRQQRGIVPSERARRQRLRYLTLRWRRRGHVSRREGGYGGQHTGTEQGGGGGLGGRDGGRDAAGQHQIHVLAGALEHLDVALFLAEDHVTVVLLLGRQVGGLLGVHLDERLAARLALKVGNMM